MPTFPDIVENIQNILLRSRTLILATAHIQEDAFEQAMAALKSWSARPDAAFWFAMCWAEGTRK
jgi:hypothetical protein